MTLKQRIQAFVQLGIFINNHISKNHQDKHQKFHNDLTTLVDIAYQYNGWFSPENIERALKGLTVMLHESDLTEFAKQVNEPTNPKTVAVIMAGNIPAVGFHDMMCVLLSGHNILIKASSDDTALITFLAGMLIYFEPQFATRINFSDGKLTDFDAVIATGSNNTAKHFEYYFSKYPHIIRKNRNSIAVLDGNESKEQLIALGEDIFRYFGLGCRNVSKLFVPKGYSFDAFFEAIFEYQDVIHYEKYANNYDYNKAVFLMSNFKLLDNGFVTIKEDTSYSSPISSVFYEFYEDLDELQTQLKNDADFLSLQKAYGIRSIQRGWWCPNKNNMNLNTIVTDMTIATEKDLLNQVLAKKGITYRF